MDSPTSLVVTIIAVAVVAAALGAALGVLVVRGRAARDLAAARTRQEVAEEHWQARLAAAEARSAVSGDVTELVAPLRQSMADLSVHVAAAETRRAADLAGVTADLRSIAEGQRSMSRQTTELSSALRHPGVRGKWGEVQLTRLVEAAGLLPDVVHRPQMSLGDSRLRPDLIVDLGAGRQVVIDSKVPLDALMDGMSPDGGEVTAATAKAHAAAVRDRVKELVGRQYAAQFDRPPDFVLLFLPADPILAAAIAGDPAIIEHSYAKGVILATPSTLLTLLRVVALAWREERAQESAEELLRLAGQAVERVGNLAGHLQDLGARINGTVAAYNKVAGSWQGRVRPVARRIAEHNGDPQSVRDLEEVDATVRTIGPLGTGDHESLPDRNRPVA